MTRQELAAYLKSQGQSALPDDQLVTEWLKRNPTFKVDEPSQGGGIAPTAIRILPAIAGGVLGSAIGPEGTLAGAAIGGGLGGGLGELGGQLYEYLSGTRKTFQPTEVAASSLIGALPLGEAKGAAPLVKRLLSGAGKGALLGGASSAIEDVVGKGQVPDPTRAAVGAGAGALLGGAGAGIASKLIPRKPAIAPITQAVDEDINPAKLIEEVQKSGLHLPPPTGPIPQPRPRTRDELLSWKTIKNYPEDVRDDLVELLEGSNDQRRGVQPIARTQALGQMLTVPTEPMHPGTMLTPEQVSAHKDVMASAGQEAYDLVRKYAAGEASPEEKLRALQRLAEFKIVGSNLSGAVTESARVLRLMRETSRVMPLTDSDFLKALMANPKFEDFDQLAKAVDATHGNMPAMYDLLVKSRTSTGLEKLQNFIYFNILSGVKTPLRKTIGDTMNTAFNLANYPFALGADVARAKVTGAPRTIMAGEFVPQVMGAMHGVMQGAKEFAFILGNGYSLKGYDKFLEQGIDQTVKALERAPKELPGGYLTNFPSRNLKAVTSFFHEVNQWMEAYGRAHTVAKQLGKEFTPEFVTNLMTGTGEQSKEFRAAVEMFGRKATFMDPSGPILQAISRTKGESNAWMRTAMTLFLPIYRLPGKVLQRGLETSPAGFFMQGAREGGREGAQAIGRATMGTLALAPFMFLAASGRLTGSGPQGGPARQALLDKGWIPNSVKIGDKWVGFHLLQPFATQMAAVGSAFDRFMESPRTEADAESAWAGLERAAFGVGRSTLDQSYFSGLSTLLRAIDEPQASRVAGVVRGLTQDLVPLSGLGRNISQAVDPILRNPQGMAENIKVVVPGMSQQVPPRLNRFGEPVIRQGGPLQRGLNPVGVSTEVQDPVGQMLEQAGVKLGTPKANLRTKATATQPSKLLPLSREEKQTIEQAIGLEHKKVLEPLTRRGRVTDRQIEDALRRATRLVDDRAKALLRQKKPLTIQRLAPQVKQADMDRLEQLMQGVKPWAHAK
jgi:hypothetical protein